MAIGVGGSTPERELARLCDMTTGIVTIDQSDWEGRIVRAQALMREQGIDALYLDATVNLNYFSGLNLTLSERLHGAILPASGPLVYITPAFEKPKIRSLLQIDGAIRVWDEHEDPGALVISVIESLGIASGRVAIDPSAPFFNVDGLRKAGNRYELINGASITGGCRSVKTPREIALLQRSNEITLTVQKAAARILRAGIVTTEVQSFIIEAYSRLGIKASNVFPPIVLFGEATAYPHGVGYPQTLKDGDTVLMDLCCSLDGYISDTTRTYVFGEPTQRQREVWSLEKAAQLAGFKAAIPGAACEDVDHAARSLIENTPGFEKDYGVPGLPHRTGHGIGMEVHEESYIVRNNKRPLETGMCFSIEPMICIYGAFGIRLEDCAYMAEDGARWFTQPAHSIDDPFGYEAQGDAEGEAQE